MVQLVVPGLTFGEGNASDQFFDDPTDVGLNGDIDQAVLVELGIVDVDVHDLSMFTELLDLTGHAIIEPDTEGEEQIGMGDGIVGEDGAVHTEPHQAEWVILRDGTDTHERGGDWDIRFASELLQRIGCLCGNDSAAAVNHGAGLLLFTSVMIKP